MFFAIQSSVIKQTNYFYNNKKRYIVNSKWTDKGSVLCFWVTTTILSTVRGSWSLQALKHQYD